MKSHVRHLITALLLATCLGSAAQTISGVSASEARLPGVEPDFSTSSINIHEKQIPEKPLLSIYAFPKSHTFRHENWDRLWVNTAVLGSAFVGSLLVLECLPDDATAWNSGELKRTPLFKRWYNHVIKEGPVWDHDLPFINFVLHPYAGAAYFMAARSCGFNFWGSLLYSTLISTVGWEFGIEAFMENPSFNDLLLTPIVGSIIGEGFYMAKHYIVNHDYCLLGSPVLGNIAAFIVDPVNEVIGLFAGNPARRWAKRSKMEIQSSPARIVTDDGGTGYGLSLSLRF